MVREEVDLRPLDAPEPRQSLFAGLVRTARPKQWAKNTLVFFTDYQCPFCSRHFRQTWPRLEQDFVKEGGIRERMTRARLQYRNRISQPHKSQ